MDSGLSALRTPPRNDGACDANLGIAVLPLRLENPKIGRVDDAEIAGDRIAEDGPVFRHLHAQEMQNGSAEVVVARVASVVGHVTMHQPPYPDCGKCWRPARWLTSQVVRREPDEPTGR